MSDVNAPLRKKVRLSAADYLRKLAHKLHTPEGAEVPDPTPLEPPLGWFKQPSMVDHIRNMIRGENLRRAAEEAGLETMDEADDFDVEDDPFPVGRAEVGDDLEPVNSLRDKKRKFEEEAPVEQIPPKAERKPAEQAPRRSQGAKPGSAGAVGDLDGDTEEPAT